MISTTQEKVEILESAWKKGGWGGAAECMQSHISYSGVMLRINTVSQIDFGL